MRLGIDIDGCLADFNESFARLVNERTGVELELPPKTWNYHLDAGVTPEQDQAIWAEIAGSPTFWVALNPLPSAKELLKDLDGLTSEHAVYFITTRVGMTAKQQTELWLWQFGITYPTVIISKAKGLIAAGLQLNIMLDDKPENLFDVKAARPECQTILVRAPYNMWSMHDPRIDARVDYAGSLLGYVD